MLSPEKAYERRWWTLAVLCMSLVGHHDRQHDPQRGAALDRARPRRQPARDLQWIIDAYVIVFACLLLTAGAAGRQVRPQGRPDRRPGRCSGRSRRSPRWHQSPEMLIVARGVDGHRRRVHLPDHVVDPHQHVRRARNGPAPSASGRACRASASRSGPLLGGLLVEHFWLGRRCSSSTCRSASLALVLGRFFIPTSRDPDNRPLDPLGALLSIVALVALLYAIIEAPEQGWLATDVVVGFGASLVLLVGVRVVGDAHARTDARRALLPQPAVLGRVGDHHPHVASRSTARRSCSRSTSSSCSATRRSRRA